MLTEWSVECAADDPVLVVPWNDPSSPGRRFIDLRENPYDLDHLSEAAEHPALMHSLRALNAPRSPVFTAKCNVWPIDPGEPQAELDHLCLSLDITSNEAPAGFSSYLDLLWRDRSIFSSFHLHEQLLHRLTRLATPLDHPYAMLDCIIRPALIDLTGPQEGFAISLYVKALGHDAPAAAQNWAAALEAATALLRSRAFSPS